MSWERLGTGASITPELPKTHQMFSSSGWLQVPASIRCVCKPRRGDAGQNPAKNTFLTNSAAPPLQSSKCPREKDVRWGFPSQLSDTSEYVKSNFPPKGSSQFLPNVPQNAANDGNHSFVQNQTKTPCSSGLVLSHPVLVLGPSGSFPCVNK